MNFFSSPCTFLAILCIMVILGDNDVNGHVDCTQHAFHFRCRGTGAMKRTFPPEWNSNRQEKEWNILRRMYKRNRIPNAVLNPLFEDFDEN